MLGGLPQTIDPVLLAEKGARLTGRLTLRGMTRLRALLLDDSGDAELDIVFERAEASGVRRMHGHIAVPAVSATCQRCLEPMQLAIKAGVDAIVLREGELHGDHSLEANALTVGLAPVVLAELVEDELLLGMPMVPMHELDECPARRYLSKGGSKDEEEKAPHPFAGLRRPE